MKLSKMSFMFGAALLTTSAFAENIRLGAGQLRQEIFTQSCSTQSKRVSGLRIVVRGQGQGRRGAQNGAFLRRVRVTFGNGQVQPLRLGNIYVPAEGRTHVLQLGAHRCIRSVMVVGEAEFPGMMAPRVVVRGINAVFNHGGGRVQPPRPLPPRPLPPRPIPPRPIPPRPRPPVVAVWQQPLSIGDVVWKTDADAWAQVDGVGFDGTYLVRYTSSWRQGTRADRVTRDKLALNQGCVESYCVGDRVWSMEADAFAVVEAIETDGDLVLKYTNSWRQGTYTDNKDKAKVAQAKDCLRGLCIGASVWSNKHNAQAIVEAFNFESGNIVIRFTSSWRQGTYSDSVQLMDLSLR